jgi:hypothetical protein
MYLYEHYRLVVGNFVRAGLPALFVSLLVQPVFAQSESSRNELLFGLDVNYVDASGHPSWAEGSAGKLLYDSDHDGLMLSRSYIDLRSRLADTLNAHVVAELYTDDMGSTVDLTEAFLEWRPLTESANRYRLKLGAFYPRISLENSGPGWTSPYSISPSAINTWVGEELRSVGAEASVSRRPESLGGAHTFSLQAAVFYGNDPAGGLISWKGWSIHDRQSRFGDKVPLPPVPLIQPGNWFDGQDPFITPLLEIDDRSGYYLNGEWRFGKHVMLRAMHYNNRADPQGYENRQFGWRTAFDHVGLQATLPGDIGLLAQWMDGYTVWGRYTNGVYSVDVEFESNYVLLTRAFERHRLTARYDHFEMSENDRIPMDENSEHGHAWTLAYQFEASSRLQLAAEWLEIFTDRPAWAYFDLAQRKTERQLQLSLRLRFGLPR